MKTADTMNKIDVCGNCIVVDCRKKGRTGHIPNCPKDPVQAAYLEAFRRRYDGMPQQKV